MADLTPGTVVGGRYRIEGVLARGGMSVVYVAVDQKFDSRVALKVAGGPGADARVLRERFKREARLANALGQSTGFVRVFDWGDLEGEGRVFLAMDLVEGARELDISSGTLLERLERVTQAMRLVARLHQVGVIHRDLKPSNFLVGQDGALRLTDFGLAKQVGQPDDAAAALAATVGLTGTGMAMGTPFYMPPEQFEDAKKADARADVYALGVMLFGALAGRLPYTGENASQVLSTQMRVRFEQRPAPRPRDYMSTLPLALDQVAARAIALDAAARFATVDELLAALERSEWRTLLPRLGGPTAAPAATDRTAPTLVGGDAPTEATPGPGVGVGAPRDTTAGPGAARASTATAGPRDAAAGPAQGRPRPPAAPPRARADATLSTAPAPPVPPIRPRDEQGRGLVASDGVAVPKVVWFVLGTLLVVGVGVNVLPRAGAPAGPGRPPATGQAPPPPSTAAPGPAAERVVPVEDLPDPERPDLDLVVRLHQAWSARTGVAEAAPGDVLDAEAAGQVSVAFEAVRLRRETRDGKEVAVTEADSARYRYACVGDAPPRIVRRGP